MLIVHVHVHVKPESAEAFVEATRENARDSVREPGVVRFDVIRQADDPGRHKGTPHYAAWRGAVEPMMAEPRRSVKYGALFPEDARWEMPASGA